MYRERKDYGILMEGKTEEMDIEQHEKRQRYMWRIRYKGNRKKGRRKEERRKNVHRRKKDEMGRKETRKSMNEERM
jgi:hypothetical protein